MAAQSCSSPGPGEKSPLAAKASNSNGFHSGFGQISSDRRACVGVCVRVCVRVGGKFGPIRLFVTVNGNQVPLVALDPGDPRAKWASATTCPPVAGKAPQVWCVGSRWELDRLFWPTCNVKPLLS